MVKEGGEGHGYRSVEAPRVNPSTFWMIIFVCRSLHSTNFCYVFEPRKGKVEVQAVTMFMLWASVWFAERKL